MTFLRTIFMRIFSAISKLIGRKPQPDNLNVSIGGLAPTPIIPRQVFLNAGDRITITPSRNEGYAAITVDIEHKLDSSLNTGGFGIIYVVRWEGKIYALKILALSEKMPDEWPELIQRFESSFVAGQLNNDYIIKYSFKGYYLDNPCILMEYCPNGNLHTRLNEYQKKEQWIDLGNNLLNALKALHGNGIIHKDFKPQNILFNEADVPKITDFDFSAFLDKRNTITKKGRVLSLWFTAVYSPPEMLDPKEAYDKTGPTMDLFAFAVTMYQVITGGKFPYGPQEEYFESPEAYYEKIKSGNFIPIHVYRPDVPRVWAECIERCLHPTPEYRIQTPHDFLMKVGYREPDNKPDSRTDSEMPIENIDWAIQIMTGANNVGTHFSIKGLCQDCGRNMISIGRDSETSYFKNDIRIDSIPNTQGTHHISRRHATIKLENGKCLVRDGHSEEEGFWKESLNGTEVFNQTGVRKISAEQYQELNEGDIIHLASEVTLKFFRNTL